MPDNPNPAGGGTPPPNPDPNPAPDWKASLPAEYREHAAIKDYKDVAGLVKSHVNMLPLLGADKVVLPKADATPEQMNEFYTKLGRPAKPEDYKLPEPKLPEGLAVDKDLQATALKLFHDAGLSPKQAERIYGGYHEAISQIASKMQATKAQEQQAKLTELKGQWGQDFDKNVNMAKQAVQAFGGDELKKWLDETGLGNEPRMIQLFSTIGAKLQEDPAGGGGPGTLSVNSAKEELSELKMDAEFQKALNDNTHAAHKEAVARWHAVHKRAYPGTQLA